MMVAPVMGRRFRSSPQTREPGLDERCKPAGSPATATVLSRDLPPADTATLVRPTPIHSAITRSTARLASPFSAAARTRTAMAPPCAVSTMPSTPSRAAFGLTRSSSRTPALLAPPRPRVGRHSMSLQIADHHDLHEPAGENEHHRRHVDAAEVGHEAPDRPQQRLGHGIEPLPDGAHELVVGIDHVEGDQPAHHRAGDDDVDVERDQETDEVEQPCHRVTLADHELARGVMAREPRDKGRCGPGRAQ